MNFNVLPSALSYWKDRYPGIWNAVEETFKVPGKKANFTTATIIYARCEKATAGSGLGKRRTHLYLCSCL